MVQPVPSVSILDSPMNFYDNKDPNLWHAVKYFQQQPSSSSSAYPYYRTPTSMSSPNSHEVCYGDEQAQMMTWYDPDACFPLAGNLAAQQQQLLTVTMPYPADLAVTSASPNMDIPTIGEGFANEKPFGILPPETADTTRATRQQLANHGIIPPTYYHPHDHPLYRSPSALTPWPQQQSLAQCSEDPDQPQLFHRCLWKGCGLETSTLEDLTVHIRNDHVGSGKPAYFCLWAGCPRRQKPFTKRHKMHNHMRTHTGERPFECTVKGCTKRFSRPDSLSTHIKTHSNVRPYHCSVPGCGKAYFHSRSLRKHTRSHEEQQQTSSKSAYHPARPRYTWSRPDDGFLPYVDPSAQQPMYTHLQNTLYT